MVTSRVKLQTRRRVVCDRYCPRCLSPTERSVASRSLRLLSRVLRVRVSRRSCAWCGWEGVQLR